MEIVNEIKQNKNNNNQSRFNVNTTYNTNDKYSDNNSTIENSKWKENIVVDFNEYWNYIAGGNIYDNSNDGLLNIINDCIHEMNRRQWFNSKNNDI